MWQPFWDSPFCLITDEYAYRLVVNFLVVGTTYFSTEIIISGYFCVHHKERKKPYQLSNKYIYQINTITSTLNWIFTCWKITYFSMEQYVYRKVLIFPQTRLPRKKNKDTFAAYLKENPSSTKSRKTLFLCKGCRFIWDS